MPYASGGAGASGAPVRVLAAVRDADASRVLTGLLERLPGAEPQPPVGTSTALLDLLATRGADSVAGLPEVVLVHEHLGPQPALELIREVALRFPAVGTVLLTGDASPAVYAAAMDSGARGVLPMPIGYEELAARVRAVAGWSTGVRRHLGPADDPYAGAPSAPLVTVAGAKGGVGTTLAAVQLALAAQASGHATVLVDLDLQTGDVASFLDVQFRRSVADLAGLSDLGPRVLQDAVFAHSTGLALLLAPAEGERAEEVTDAAARQLLPALRARYDAVIVDCGSHLDAAGAVAVEQADTALLVTTPDVVAVRGVKRQVRLWDRLQIRKAEDTLTVVNRHTRGSEIQPPLIRQITGTRLARTTVPAAFKELQGCLDSSRMHELDARGSVRQALWALAGEVGLVAGPGADAASGPAPGSGSASGGGFGAGKGLVPFGGGSGGERGALVASRRARGASRRARRGR
ncbi:AAA family ATPase [Streptomyces sp. JJ66]|uniref:AAA family ATPase n=1 Tax=Streptomyces sp. JJ66 TaxID=2803843 RepID=UPI001C5A4839|nr:AAA family ATPase [Streptomyces sp. JJ66]MBW1602784.1 AAA family ATPase [Streptomyces sp. JJ66]